MKSMELQCWKTLFDLKKNILSIQEELSKWKLSCMISVKVDYFEDFYKLLF